VVCLQETKTEDATFPVADVQAAGYQLIYSGQRTYNGVAILSRTPVSEVAVGISGFADEQKRVLAATVDGVRVVCIYVPNGESVESDKYRYKLSWLAALKDWLAEQLKQYPRLVLLGDTRPARDVHDQLCRTEGALGEPERSAFRSLLSLGQSGFRLLEQRKKHSPGGITG
jgi:exodeoxyribonuclease-3